MLRTIAVAVVMFTAVVLTAADKSKLEGTWKLDKSDSELPKGASAVIVFEKNGTFNMKIEVGTTKVELPGTWTLDGDKLTVVQKDPTGKQKTETMKIEKLDDTDLVTIDEKGKKDQFKKSK